MAVIKTLVAKSNNIKDAALNLNAKAFEVRRTLAATWELKPTSVTPPPPAESFSLDMKNESGESVVGDGDERVMVDPVHFAPGGKYRSIVKLFIHYEFQKPNSWAMGTGWLVSPDILVTAGHCSYDWSHKMGRATEVKAYIGYSGHLSEKEASVQFRRVKKIVTTEGWVKTKGQKCFDVSFMQVDAPFQGITPIQFTETPATGSLELGVVGYPGDLSDKQTGEKGAHMYEMFLKTDWDLATQTDTMLEYQIDTFGGNSGSPVFRKPDMVSIGAHVYGGTFNSASVIGKFGNPYTDYLAAFNLQVPNEGLNLIPVTGNAAIDAPVPSGFVGSLPGSMKVTGPAICEVCRIRKAGDTSANVTNGTVPGQAISTLTHTAQPAPSRAVLAAPFRPTQPSRFAPDRAIARTPGSFAAPATRLHGADEEGFFDILKKAASVAAPVVGSALSFAGPVGALAGFALNAAGKMCESAEAEGFVDGAPPVVHEGSVERAVLAEATLSALQSMQLSHEAEESIFDDIKDTVVKALPTVRKAAPHVLGAMMEPALRIALDSLHKYNSKGGSAEAFEDPAPEPFRPHALYTRAIDQPAGRKEEEFLAHLQASITKHKEESALDDDSAESFGDFLRAGLRVASGVVQVASKGLPLIVQATQALSGGQESVEAGSGSAAEQQPHGAFSADALAHRALVAEAALQAVMKQPPQHLQEEGFFDSVASFVRTIAPVALKVAPSVISAINPAVGSVVKKVLGQESVEVEGATNGRPAVAAPRARRLGGADGFPALRSQRSLDVIRHEGGGGGSGLPRRTYEGYGQRENSRPRSALRQPVNYSRPLFEY